MACDAAPLACRCPARQKLIFFVCRINAFVYKIARFKFSRCDPIERYPTASTFWRRARTGSLPYRSAMVRLSFSIVLLKETAKLICSSKFLLNRQPGRLLNMRVGKTVQRY